MSIRQPCIGGCGREVPKRLGGECRKCRRKRIHAGLKRVLRVKRSQRADSFGLRRTKGAL